MANTPLLTSVRLRKVYFFLMNMFKYLAEAIYTLIVYCSDSFMFLFCFSLGCTRTLYSVMQSDRSTLKFNVVITKFLRRHYRIMGSERNMKSMIEIYFNLLVSNMSKHLLLAREKWQFFITVPI